MTLVASLLRGAGIVLERLNRHRRVSLAVILPAILLFHTWAALGLIRESNQDSRASDQGAEMWLGATSREDWWPQRTDGVRHPLWSWTVRHLFTEDQAAFFERGKWLNTAISLIFLAGLGLAVSRWLDPLATANLLLLGSLGILLVRGTYFQPEPLYYIFFFLATVLAWRLLGNAPWWRWLVFGAVCALAFLAKPALAPFLLVFALALGLRVILLLIRRQTRAVAALLAGGAAAAVLFGLALTPLGLFSQKHFGKPFFNYPQYWMWMDDFETEAWPWQDKYPGRLQLENLTPADTPGLRWYFARHSAGDALHRIAEGARDVSARFFFPEPKLKASAVFGRFSTKKWEQPLAHRGIFLLLLGGLAAALAIPLRRTIGPALSDPEFLPRAVYVAAVPVVYVLLYGWYWPIGRGDRFMGSLWIPAVFFLTWLAHRLRLIEPGVKRDGFYLVVHGGITILLLLQIAALVLLFTQGHFPATRN